MVTSLNHDLKSGQLAMNPPAVVSPQEGEAAPEGEICRFAAVHVLRSAIIRSRRM